MLPTAVALCGWSLQAAGVPYAEYELSEQVEVSLSSPLPAAPVVPRARRTAGSQPCRGHARQPLPTCCRRVCCAGLQVLARIKEATGQSTVPQVFAGGQLLGGASELLPLLDSGALQRQLAQGAGPPLPPALQAIVQAAAQQQQQQAAAAAESAAGGDRKRLRQLAAELRGALASGSGHAFTLQAAAQWLQQARGQGADAAAATLGQLQAAQLVTVAAPAGAADAELALTAQAVQARPQLLLRLVADAPQPSRWKEPLNGHFAWFGPARPAEQARVWVDAAGGVMPVHS